MGAIMDALQPLMDWYVETIQNPFDCMAVDTWSYIAGQNTTVSYWTLDWWEQGVDSRTKGFLFVDMSSISMAFVLLSYVLFAVFIVPKWMKNRKPYDMKRLMIFYDFSMVAINIYFFGYAVYHIRDMFDFSNPKYDTSEKAMDFIKTAHFYYLSKYMDFFDTVFMGLRKKNSHITFLHVWHHLSIPGGGWMMLRYNPYMPTQYLFPLFNGLVHAVMYGYYGLAALGPHMQKYLWWKRYITQMQLIQFTVGLVWIPFVIYTSTDLPFFFNFLNLFNDIVLFVLFLNFYIKSYRSNRKQNLKSN